MKKLQQKSTLKEKINCCNNLVKYSIVFFIGNQFLVVAANF